MTPVERYLQHLYEIRSSGDATNETSYYVPLSNLLSEVGKLLKPRVRCVMQLKNRGAGNPDGGLYTPDQFQRLTDTEAVAGQKPARGAIEVKSTKDDAFVTADGPQVTRYWNQYGQVLVTNYRDFVLLARDADGQPVKIAPFRIAPDEKTFWKMASQPRSAAVNVEGRLIDFLKLALSSQSTLTTPEEVAWILAYYAREAKWRVEANSNLKALGSIREALEQALGIKFEGPKGEHFFRSTLIQTLFYGVFSAWVLWSKQHGSKDKTKFDWRLAQWSLKVPMIRALFEEVATPGRLGPLGIVEILDWTTSALNRVERTVFFTAFEEQEAVQYFYEPFLQAFDPQLRKELGVWYTPLEVVRYMVAKTDTILRTELGIKDGFADDNVFVLDPGCGTGAYLVEVLRTIQATLAAKGKDPLAAHSIKRAAIDRIFGFELLPAPFVISHLQIGLALQNLGAPLRDDGTERAGVYLTNALTGWLPPTGPKAQLALKELEEERDAAERVKQQAPILVVIGNPPYNGYAGVGMAEEQSLVDPYRHTSEGPPPQGQGLNDLYVRFFRIAERRIVEGTKQGIVCFIANYSWLNGLSHPGMRERFLNAFDGIWIDSLNGDKYRTGKVTPEGQPDPSVFSTASNPEGIQVGTAIALLVRKEEHQPARKVEFRSFWGRTKRNDLLDSLQDSTKYPYIPIVPTAQFGFVFKPLEASVAYSNWPELPQLFPVSFAGVKTSRDGFLVGFDVEEVENKLSRYLSNEISHEEMARIEPDSMNTAAGFKAEVVRDYLRGRSESKGEIVRYTYRAFDLRWLYWDSDSRLLDRSRPEFKAQIFENNRFIEARQRESVSEFSRGTVTSSLADNFGNGLSSFFPAFIKETSLQPTLEKKDDSPLLNLSEQAIAYVGHIGLERRHWRALFDHSAAILHAPAFRKENGEALRQDWPRIPLPRTSDLLLESGSLGDLVSRLIDPAMLVNSVTSGQIAPELQLIATITPVRGKTIDPDQDLLITAGWGHAGRDGAAMPGKGHLEERDYTVEEREGFAIGAVRFDVSADELSNRLGEHTVDIYLNDRAYLANVPLRVWEYTMGGYQVMKKWLSYRESKLLGRALTPQEAYHLRDVARRIAAICILGADLDSNYAKTKLTSFEWPI